MKLNLILKKYHFNKLSKLSLKLFIFVWKISIWYSLSFVFKLILFKYWKYLSFIFELIKLSIIFLSLFFVWEIIELITLSIFKFLAFKISIILLILNTEISTFKYDKLWWKSLSFWKEKTCSNFLKSFFLLLILKL